MMWVELLGRAERWRRWSLEDRGRIIQGSCVAGVSVCSVACRHGIAQGLLFTCRRQAREGRLDRDGLAPQKWRALFLKEEGSDGRPEANLYP
ncbi:transposase [Methylobacterium sp. CM6257]